MPIERAGRSMRIAVSLGIALFPEHAMDAGSLVRCADEALYYAKRAGRDRVCAYQLAAAGSPVLTGDSADSTSTAHDVRV